MASRHGADGRQDRTLLDETVLLHLAPKRDGADLQRVGGLPPIAVKTLEGALNEYAFQRLEIKAIV